MYLYVWLNGRIRQVNDNPTIGDLAAVQAGVLTIVRAKGSSFQRLADPATWVDVDESAVIFCQEARFHT